MCQKKSGSGPKEGGSSRKKKSSSNLKEVQVAMGLFGFYRKFVPGFEKTSEPPYQLLNKEEKFLWTNECE